eukprot:5569300-Prorocentrum_lima.AAC.1
MNPRLFGRLGHRSFGLHNNLLNMGSERGECIIRGVSLTSGTRGKKAHAGWPGGHHPQPTRSRW